MALQAGAAILLAVALFVDFCFLFSAEWSHEFEPNWVPSLSDQRELLIAFAVAAALILWPAVLIAWRGLRERLLLSLSLVLSAWLLRLWVALYSPNQSDPLLAFFGTPFWWVVTVLAWFIAHVWETQRRGEDAAPRPYFLVAPGVVIAIMLAAALVHFPGLDFRLYVLWPIPPGVRNIVSVYYRHDIRDWSQVIACDLTEPDAKLILASKPYVVTADGLGRRLTRIVEETMGKAPLELVPGATVYRVKLNPEDTDEMMGEHYRYVLLNPAQTRALIVEDWQSNF